MSNRRNRTSLPRREGLRKKRRKLLQRNELRRMLVETLERRELLAVGPQLIGIQPNNDALLRLERTDIRNVAPQELVFKFDENQRFDAEDLRNNPGRIQVTASGKDGSFAPATTVTDLGTNGVVQVLLTAVRLGDDQNGISLSLTKSNQGAPGAPTITVNGQAISARLNTNPFNETTALDLVNALNTNLDSSALVRAEILSGNPDQILATNDPTEPQIPSSTLSGANDQVIRPGFIGPAAAPNENEIIVRFADSLPDDLYRIDVFGEHPLLALRSTNRDCTYTVNGVLFAGCALGDLTEDGIDNGGDFDPIFFELDLAPQIHSVVPQPVTRNAAGQLQQARDQLVVYFNDDDLFAPDVVFNGTDFTDTDTITIDNGLGQAEVFELDSDNSLVTPLGRRVIFNADSTPDQLALALADAINNTPGFGIEATATADRVTLTGNATVTLSTGIMGVSRGVDHFVNSAENPNFYKLFFTGETVENTDDDVFVPTAVQYDPATDSAVLTFASDLEALQRSQTISVDTTTDRILTPSHRLVDGDIVRVESTGSLPTGLQPDVDYFVLNRTPDTFQLALTLDSAPADITDAGTGQHSFTAPVGPGVFRLRIGTDEAQPAAPFSVGLEVEANSDFNSGGNVIVQFESDELTAEQFGSAIRVSTTTSDHGGPSLPNVVVTGNQVLVDLNINPGNESTAQELVDAINLDGRAAALLFASIADGNPDERIATSVPNHFTVKLTGLGSSFDTATDLSDVFETGAVIDVVGAGADLVDGQSFTVVDKNGVAQTFEFDDDGAVTVGNTPIFFGPNNTSAEITAAMLGAITTATTISNLDVTATASGNLIRLANDSDVTLEGGVTALELTTQGVLLSSAIDPQLFPLDYPGSKDEPGHREISVSGVGDEHIDGDQKDTDFGITTFRYIFRTVYGSIPDIQGGQQPAFNLITETQKERAREVFELIGQNAGVHFIETDDVDDPDALIVATGDLRAVNPNINSSAGGITSITGGTSVGTALIMDSAELWNDQFGQESPGELSWFRAAFQAAERFLGVGVGLDLPPTNVLGFDQGQVFDNAIEPVFPGDGDIAHLQRLFRPESKDIDLYRFTIDVPAGKQGVFTAETFAERQRNASGLDTTLNLYRETVDANGVVMGRELIARNDDYYSNDSYIEVELGAGTYYVGVSASGNDIYDPIIEDSGIGGTTQGPYDLRLNFRPDADFSLVDADNFDLPPGAFTSAENEALTTQTPLDGDADGIPGGVYNFWFKTQNEHRQLDVMTDGAGLVDGQVITLTDSQGAIRRFEINQFGSVTPGNRGVDVFGFSAAGVAARIADAINAEPGFLISATTRGSKVTLVGERSISLTPDFTGLDVLGRTVYVDKTAPPNPDGTLARPFSNLASTNAINAVQTAHDGDIIRVVGNDPDGDATTLTDREAFEIGFNSLGQPLTDGTTLEIPKGVTMMIDEGAVFKLRRARIGVGSSAPGIDHSRGALQVLGTPENNVYFTSFHDEAIGRDTFPFVTTPLPSDWGGLLFSDDVDRGEGNFVYDEEGIFLNYVNNADIRYGGGNVVINSVAQVVNPIHIIDTRPTIAFNTITHSADAAMSASPNSFEETNFHAPRHQNFAFTSDYDRVGPDIYGNTIQQNSTNGLFVRIQTPAGNAIRTLTVSGRFDDTDVVHIFGENLQITGTPGGAVEESTVPPVTLITLDTTAGGTLLPGDYSYRLTFVDLNGNEGPISDETPAIPIGIADRSVVLAQLPKVSGDFVARNLYRSVDGGAFELVAQLNGLATAYVDDGTTRGGSLEDPIVLVVDPLDPTGPLVPSGVFRRARLDARLAIDPSIVVKLDGARLETGIGGQIIAEGKEGLEIKFTSLLDDRFGAGGTFDTANDGPNSPGSNNEPKPGDWGGVMLGEYSSGHFDHVLFAYGGGVTRVEGTFTAFNMLEIHQADARVTNSVFERNASGRGGQGEATNPGRFGRGFNEPGTIFIRGAQPIITDNIIRDNESAAINVNVNSLNHHLNLDRGRVTGEVDLLEGFRDNQGPLIFNNRLADNLLNGMLVRGQTVTTQSVWDDTDIVHVVEDTIYVPDFHTFGGLRLESNPTSSLVVKLLSQDPNGQDPNIADDAGLRAFGRPLETDDRIGGAIQILGQPKSPVVLTSLNDDTIGAGFDPRGDVQTRTRDIGDSLQLLQPDSSIAATLVGNLGVTTDGIGTNATGTLSADIPLTAVVERAFLHVVTRNGDATTFPAPPAFRPQSIRFEGQTVPISYLSNVDDSTNVNFEVGRIDVTDIVAVSVADQILNAGTGAPPQPFTFTIDETATGLPNNVEGVALTVIYSEAALPQSTVLILDGGLGSQSSVTNTLTFAEPAIPGDPDFVAQLSLGVAFNPDPASLGGTTVSVNGTRLTSSAGGSDDSIVGPPAVNGSIITVGGVSDGPVNPVLPTSAASADDELYDLRPFIPAGATQVRLDVGNDAFNTSAFLAVLNVSGNVSLGSAGRPGEWEGITLEEYSHDRNVETVTELEPREVISPGTNATTDSAQFLGQLAPHEKGGDENRRLGFEIHGFLNDRSDYDVYSFRADAATEVWFDVDRTTHALDSIIELIDVDGTVIARSDNSYAESLNANNALAPVDRTSTNLSLAELTDPTLLDGIARLMQKSPPFEGEDFYTTNPRDPGMRLILPGALGSTNTYHLRIRSSSDDLANLDGGLTSGAYQLQIRLREVDEVPGSTVRFSSISFAETGIAIQGQPIHSPLLGEAAEVEGANTDASVADAQVLGNLVAIDRAALGIAGELENFADIDFYQFDVNFQQVQLTPTTLEVAFDLDYADGLGRANTVMSVFDGTGRLILHSREGNIADDRPGRPGTSEIDDLSRGSVGSSDPFIGGVELPRGTYFLAVSSDARIPAQLEQFFQRTPLNPNLRLEPVDSVRRIAEDHIVSPFTGVPNYQSTFDAPQIPILLQPSSEIDFHLGDVGLFVTTRISPFETFGIDSYDLSLVDPFTGSVENFVGDDVDYDIRDFAIHENGLIYAYSVGLTENLIGSPRDDNSGIWLQIDPATGDAIELRDDGIETYQIDPDSTDSPPTSIRTNLVQGTLEGDGIQFQALEFAQNLGFGGFAVGNRGFNTPPFTPNGPTRLDNILYQFVADQTAANFGVPVSAPEPDRVDQDVPLDRFWFEAGTDIRERGELLTSPRIETFDATTQVLNRALNELETVFNIEDGDTITVRDRSAETTFEFDFGFEVDQLVDGRDGVTIRDGNFFFLNDDLFQLNTGPVLTVVSDGRFIRSKTVVTVADSAGLSQNFELLDIATGDAVTGTNIAVPYAASFSQAAVVSALAGVINASALDVQAFFSPNSGRLTLVDPTPDPVTGQFGRINVDVSFGNANRSNGFIPIPSSGIIVEGDNGEAPVSASRRWLARSTTA